MFIGKNDIYASIWNHYIPPQSDSFNQTSNFTTKRLQSEATVWVKLLKLDWIDNFKFNINTKKVHLLP